MPEESEAEEYEMGIPEEDKALWEVSFRAILCWTFPAQSHDC